MQSRINLLHFDILVFATAALLASSAEGSDDMLAEALALANSQKEPYKGIILENIEKQFKAKDSDGGIKITEQEFNTLKQFAKSMATYEASNSGKNGQTDIKSTGVALNGNQAVPSKTQVQKPQPSDPAKIIEELINNAQGEMKEFLTWKRDLYKDKKSEGGVAITPFELEDLIYLSKAYYYDPTSKEKAKIKEGKAHSDHIKRIKELFDKRKGGFKNGAMLCKEYAEYLKSKIKSYRTANFGGGVTPEYSTKIVAELDLPPIKYTGDDERMIMQKCLFPRYQYESKIITTAGVHSNVKQYCEDCNLFWGSAWYMDIGQKLEDGVYNARSILQVSGMHLRNTYMPSQAHKLISPGKYSAGGVYIWGLWAGQESVTMANGFNQELDVIIDIGPLAASAIFTRFIEFANYFQSIKDKGDTTSCGYRFDEDRLIRRGLSPVGFIEIGCYQKKTERIKSPKM